MVEQIFDRLAAEYPHTPLIVLSALAEGADRLVADVGLRRDAKLIVPLPMAAGEYMADFTTPESRAEFERLRAQGTEFVVPFDDREAEANSPLLGDARDRRYAAGGAYIAVNSDVLIALWNGAPLDRLGGTACIVGYKLKGVPEPYAPRPSPLDVVESGPVYHIVTPRLKDRAEPPEAFDCKMLYPSNWKGDPQRASAFYIDIYKHIDRFNHDMLFPPVAFDATASATAQLYTIADALALRFQRFARRTLRAIFLFVGLSVVAFAVYAHVNHAPLYLAVDVGGFIIATCLYLFGQVAQLDKKYQDYRALAEGLRVQLHWRDAEITDSVATIYLRKQKSELDWIRDAIRSIRVLADAEAERNRAQGSLADRLSSVHEHWVVNQRNWFARTLVREQHLADRFNSSASAIFVGGLLIAFGVVSWLFALHLDPDFERREQVVAFIALTAIIAGLLHGYAEKRAWAAHVKQYQRMHVVFTNADLIVEPLLAEPTVENLKQARELVHELGREALIENADWLLLHRDRRTDIPIGG